ncbi:hypothetical protein [Shewanella surugensis]|uniref:Uncharacterized protein n=1 Tax=Shewanella surugensis TaxID=212020 RepID=A0ABT0LJ10_9GAMM|nr:hypothetical protein [Shewanella surugensis]MCL1127584.1 hypothetical protein [Shewanella surugensis]
MRLKLIGFTGSENMHLEVSRVYANVLERKQDFDEAVRTYQTMRRAYSHFGYKLVEVPLGSVSDRVDFIFTSLE